MARTISSTATTASALTTPIARTRTARTTAITPATTTSTTTARRYAATAAGAADAHALRKTPLYNFHVANGAKMVPFAGHHMPVLYSSLGLAESHKFTRTHASLFDVSHMVQHRFAGPGAGRFLESACPSGVEALQPMRGGLTTFLWPRTGGIVDDGIITRLDADTFYVVTNGACRDKDLAFLDEQMAAWQQQSRDRNGGVEAAPEDAVERTSYQGGLLALQGPLSAEILGEVLADNPAADGAPTDLSSLVFGSCMWARVRLHDGTTTSPLLISRGGYTGEDGFEIAAAPSVTLDDDMTRLAETLLATAGPERLQLAGLGARDSLRLEAGMCLYGHDLDDATTPVEAGLAWVIPPERRKPGAAPFNGSEIVLPQLVPRSKGGAGVLTRRVGLMLAEGAGPAARGGVVIRVL
jgi:aminomethyltransferase